MVETEIGKKNSLVLWNPRNLAFHFSRSRPAAPRRWPLSLAAPAHDRCGWTGYLVCESIFGSEAAVREGFHLPPRCTEAAASGVGIRSDLDPVVSCGGWRGGRAQWIVGSDRWVDGLVEGNGAEADLYRIGVGIAGRNHDGGLGVAEPFRIGGSGSLVGGGLEEGGRAGLFTGLDFRSGFGPYWFGSLMGCGILRCWSISGGMALVVRVRPWGNCGGGGCGEVQLLAWTGGSLGFLERQEHRESLC